MSDVANKEKRTIIIVKHIAHILLEEVGSPSKSWLGIGVYSHFFKVSTLNFQYSTSIIIYAQQNPRLINATNPKSGISNRDLTNYHR
jgi:hypothetical protein